MSATYFLVLKNTTSNVLVLVQFNLEGLVKVYKTDYNNITEIPERYNLPKIFLDNFYTSNLQDVYKFKFPFIQFKELSEGMKLSNLIICLKNLKQIPNSNVKIHPIKDYNITNNILYVSNQNKAVADLSSPLLVKQETDLNKVYVIDNRSFGFRYSDLISANVPGINRTLYICDSNQCKDLFQQAQKLGVNDINKHMLTMSGSDLFSLNEVFVDIPELLNDSVQIKRNVLFSLIDDLDKFGLSLSFNSDYSEYKLKLAEDDHYEQDDETEEIFINSGVQDLKLTARVSLPVSTSSILRNNINLNNNKSLIEQRPNESKPKTLDLMMEKDISNVTLSPLHKEDEKLRKLIVETLKEYGPLTRKLLIKAIRRKGYQMAASDVSYAAYTYLRDKVHVDMATGIYSLK